MGIAAAVELSQQQASVCVIEGDHRDDGVHFVVRRLGRFPRRLPYPRIAEELDMLFLKLKLRGFKSFPVFINETAVGPPVVDLIHKACRGNRFERVSFSHGHQAPEYVGTSLMIGKGWLVSHLQVLLQTGRLHLPRSPDADILANDLTSYQGPPSSDGQEVLGSFRVGTRDDLVNALGLAVHRNPPRRLTPEERQRREMRLSARPRSVWDRLYGSPPSGRLGSL